MSERGLEAACGRAEKLRTSKRGARARPKAGSGDEFHVVRVGG